MLVAGWAAPAVSGRGLSPPLVWLPAVPGLLNARRNFLAPFVSNNVLTLRSLAHLSLSLASRAAGSSSSSSPMLGPSMVKRPRSTGVSAVGVVAAPAGALTGVDGTEAVAR